MQKSKLTEMLSAFTPAEMKEFEKFVASPYFSRGRDLSSIFKVLKTFYPDFSHKNFTSEFVFKKLFPGKIFEEKSSANLINTMTSELFKLGKIFLIQLELDEDITLKNYYLLNGMRKKNLISEFEKENKRIEEYENKQEGGGSEYFVNKYILNKTYTEYYFSKQDYEKGIESIAKRASYLTIAAMISGFNNIEQQTIAEKIFSTRTGLNISDLLIRNINMKSFIEDLENHNIEFYEFVRINYLAYRMCINPEKENYFYELKEAVYKNIGLFNLRERFVLLGKLKSYCVDKINEKGNQKFAREEFELTVKSLELGCYKHDKDEYFQLVIFRNIVLSAIDCNELDWLGDFIEKYSGELPPEQVINMRHYSFAMLEYAKKNYETALENLIKVKYEFFLFKIDVKDLMFKIYFEMELYENAIPVLNTMKQYVDHTKDLSDSFKVRYRNFIKYSNELLKIKLSGKTGNKKDTGFLKKKIENESSLSSRQWLIEKIRELS